MKYFLVVIYLSSIFFISACVKTTTTASTTPGSDYPANWETLGKYNEQPYWFKDVKFGNYFHLGVLSVPAFANDWYPRNMHIKGTPEHQHHMATYYLWLS